MLSSGIRFNSIKNRNYKYTFNNFGDVSARDHMAVAIAYSRLRGRRLAHLLAIL